MADGEKAGASPYPVAILAGGMATRLRPITEKIPKALVDVAGEAFIRRQLNLLHSKGLRRAVICAGHMGDMIRDEIGNGDDMGISVAYSFDGQKLLGTAGALAKARDLLGEAFFVLYGDSYLRCDYIDVQRAFEASGKPALMTVYENREQYDRGNVLFHDGQILVYDKKNHTPDMRWIDYGLGVLRTSTLDRVRPGEFADLSDLYRDLLAQGLLAGFELRERFYEIGSFAGLEELSRLLQSTPRGTDSTGVSQTPNG